MRVEFCPECYYPLDSSNDDGRLCSACNWFGDKAETHKKPHVPNDLEVAFVQLLRIYRDQCRMEIVAEQFSEAVKEECPDAATEILKVRELVRRSEYSIIRLFRASQKSPEAEEEC